MTALLEYLNIVHLWVLDAKVNWYSISLKVYSEKSPITVLHACQTVDQRSKPRYYKEFKK